MLVGGNFWDGRATGEKFENPAADQALGPFLNPRERALPDAGAVVAWICGLDSGYADQFLAVWGAAGRATTPPPAIMWPSRSRPARRRRR